MSGLIKLPVRFVNPNVLHDSGTRLWHQWKFNLYSAVDKPISFSLASVWLYHSNSISHIIFKRTM